MTRQLRCSVFIATSMDGFIARTDGSLDWLAGGDPDSDEAGAADDPAKGDASGYFAFIASCDVLVMGRATYDTVLGFGVGWPYELPVVVLTNRPLVAPDGGDVRIMAGPVSDVVARLELDGFRHAYIDGGDVIQQLLVADLLDDMIVSIAPVLLGAGISLFGALPEDRPFVAGAPAIIHDGMIQLRWVRDR